MANSDWNEVLSKLEVRGGPVKPVCSNDIIQYEKSTGKRLPTSYSDYCQIIGPGELVSPWCYQIRVPGAHDKYYDLQHFNQYIQTFDTVSVVDVAQFKRALFFASDIGNGLYYWDPADLTQQNDNECGIYVMYSDYKVDRLADTFWDFVNRVCLATSPPEYEKAKIEPTFGPA